MNLNLNTLLKRVGTAVIALTCMTSLPTHAEDTNPDNRLIGFISATKEGSGDGDIVLSSDQEKAACQFFKDTYCGESGQGDLLSTRNLSGLNARQYKCVWIHIDRKNIQKGWRNLPEDFISPEVIRALHDYMLEGGNIYLTGQATQLVVPIWRVNQKFTVNQWDNPGDDLVTTPDTWAIRTDYENEGVKHPIFDELTTIDGKDNCYGILGGAGILRENHNTIWGLENLTYKYGSSENEEGWGTDLTNVRKFEKDNLATVLATFDWDSDGKYAGIVEFHPVYSWNEESHAYDRQSGTIICNGIAAMQWDCNETNECRSNLEQLTKNAISYLCGTPAVKNEHPYCLPSSDDSVEILESTGMIAMYIDFPNAGGLDELKKRPQEYAAYNYFVDNFVMNPKFNGKARVIWGDETAQLNFAGQEDTTGKEGFECIWINIARLGLHGELNADGSIDESKLNVNQETGLPDINPTAEDLKKIYAINEGQYEQLITKLKEFRAAGGNIYTSKWANLMLPEIAGIMSPTQVTCSPKTVDNEEEVWGINVAPHNTMSDRKYSQLDHPINQGMPTYEKKHGIGYSLLTGKGKRRDANCVWWLDQNHCKDAAWNLDPIPSLLKFNNDYNATVIGVWGHNEENIALRTAVIVEFHPEKQKNVTESENGPMRVTPKPTVLIRRGSIIANGVGAYEWSALDANDENNVNYSEDDSNVRKLTSNILSYLTPVMTEPTYTGIEEIAEDNDNTETAAYFNLQGIRVDRPESGIYIEVRGPKIRKVAF